MLHPLGRSQSGNGQGQGTKEVDQEQTEEKNFKENHNFGDVCARLSPHLFSSSFLILHPLSSVWPHFVPGQDKTRPRDEFSSRRDLSSHVVNSSLISTQQTLPAPSLFFAVFFLPL